VTDFSSRRDYAAGELHEDEVLADPVLQFNLWLTAAVADERIDEPHAMSLATTEDGQPKCRIVLLRRVDETGMSFFTNYDSDKGHQLDQNPYAALTFYWGPMERQVRVEGAVQRLSAKASDDYFTSRPYMSRLGALASPQSTIIADRYVLSTRMEQLKGEFPEGSDIPRPQNWGGFVVAPEMIEFWQGRRSRLHDRLRYSKASGEWMVQRLAP